MEEKRCPGCGAVLQTLDDHLEGYIPASLYDREDAICQRCYRLKHYGEFKEVPLVQNEFVKMLRKANEEKSLLVYVLDIFNFAGSIIDNLMDYVPDCPILVLVNKYDLLPKSLKESRILDWVHLKLKEENINYLDALLISARTNKNTEGLLDRIIGYSNNKNIYVIGNANVGKSSLINALLKDYNNTTDEYITSSIFPGTTIKNVKIPLGNGVYLYDTPGLMNDTCIYRYLDAKNLKRVIKTKEIKPLNITVYPGQSLFIGSLACVDLIEGDNTSFLVYGANDLKIHKTRTEGSAEKFVTLQKEPIYVPKANCFLSKATMDCYEFNLVNHKRISLMISGLVWLDILKGRQKIKVYVPKGVKVIESVAMIGGASLDVNK